MSCGKPCNCLSYRDHLKSIRFGASSMPNRKRSQEFLDVEKRERQLDRDMPAYKRLRQDGIQPRHILGSQHWEQNARDRIEIEHETHYGKDLNIAKEVNEALTDAYTEAS